jgi:hypothetical protein
MLARIFKRLEIVGYARAIGHMMTQAGVTNEMIQSLQEAKAECEAQLVTMKKQANVERFGKTLNSTTA